MRHRPRLLSVWDSTLGWTLRWLAAVAGIALVLALVQGVRPVDAGAPSPVVVDPDVLDDQGERWLDEDGELGGWMTSPVFFVSPGSSDAAVEAVRAAAVRFMAINEHGRETEDWEQETGYFHTPSYVAIVRSDSGLALVTDTSGDLPRAQGDAMIAVLVEELGAHGVHARISGAPDGWETGQDVMIPWPVEPLPPKDIKRRWYVLRTVQAMAATGVPYQEPEWRRPDGTWTRDRAEAQAFDAPPSELVYTLRTEQLPARTGQPTSVRMPVDPAYVPWSLPSDELREPG